MVVFERTSPALSELDIKRVENRLGVRLPQDLKAHYLLHNGGRPRPQFFVKDGEAYDVDCFYSMNTGAKGSSFERTYVMMVDQTPEFPRGYIPFADDSAGDMFLYSVRPESFGNIMFNSHEDYEDPDRYVVFLAPTLKEFIDSLTELPDGME
jgi:cell wall assembly regulator SMI1